MARLLTRLIALGLAAPVAAQPRFRQAPGAEDDGPRLPAEEPGYTLPGGSHPGGHAGPQAGGGPQFSTTGPDDPVPPAGDSGLFGNEVEQYAWIDWTMQTLVDIYPYMGIAFVCLLFYLFVRPAPSSRRAGDEAFFDDDYRGDIPYT